MGIYCNWVTRAAKRCEARKIVRPEPDHYRGTVLLLMSRDEQRWAILDGHTPAGPWMIEETVTILNVFVQSRKDHYYTYELLYSNGRQDVRTVREFDAIEKSWSNHNRRVIRLTLPTELKGFKAKLPNEHDAKPDMLNSAMDEIADKDQAKRIITFIQRRWNIDAE